jgi:hypothetical protein
VSLPTCNTAEIVCQNVPETPQTVTHVSLVGSFARLPSFLSSLSDVHTRSQTNGESSSPLQAYTNETTI